jgi:DNA-binding beta-propeller fold protein YncE
MMRLPGQPAQDLFLLNASARHSTNHVTATINLGGVAGTVAVSPDGAQLYVTNQMERGSLLIITRQ